ncbi:Mitochondrial import inner membrane translocase subunit tim23-2 [Thalictrum thalictroides]|uniref:Mitochondrial import inner membrane translocase subunit tim23-2 n=1 Tax=Thalictrum thalictroides TaxID=46969 RepID=A0A7J6X3G6_THATH|nr:Mitochondrial import inner membrane translocase subunit tim23-2 [Thalictrum thalictroides]
MANKTPDQENTKTITKSSKPRIPFITAIYMLAKYNDPFKKITCSSPKQKATQELNSWGTILLLLPGTAYLTGSIVGFTKGSIQGVIKPYIFVPATRKILINRVFNTGIETGKRYGGTLGVLGIMYTSIEAGVVYLTGRVYPYDPFNTVVAGFGTGVLYKGFTWPRPRGAVSCAGLVGALTAVTGKQLLKFNNERRLSLR